MKFAPHRHHVQSPWRTLALGLWLFSFVFSFAASDCFHSATCSEQALLKWASHATHASVHGGTFHGAHVDTDCAACALQCVALMCIAALSWGLLLLSFALGEKQNVRVRPTFLPAQAIARGPPFCV